MPKCGWVRFRWSRSLPAGKLGQARVTVDRAGRWHVSFSAAQPAVDRVPNGAVVGVDRGVTTALVTSSGQHYRAPHLRAGREAVPRAPAEARPAGQGVEEPSADAAQDGPHNGEGYRPAA